MVTIQFDIGNSTVNESDGSVTVNLVRMGNLSDNITVGISIIMILDPGIVQCMRIAYTHVCIYSNTCLIFMLWM